MKAAVIDQWGQPPRYADFPEPQAGVGTLTATVEASALTNLTKGIGNGTHYASREMRLPMVPGVDGVARLDDGRRVYTGAVPPYGMLAERTLLNAHDMVELPDGIDAVTAAAVPNPGISSWLALEHAAALRPGEHVLVLGATGVTGSLAAQLAASVFGAGRVVVAGRDAARLDWLRTVGADDIIDLRNDDVRARVHALHTAQPFDVVLDYLWGNPAAQVLAALADGPTGPITAPGSSRSARWPIRGCRCPPRCCAAPVSSSRGSASVASRRQSWPQRAPRHYPDCSTWSATAVSTCARPHGRWPISPTRGPRPTRLAPGWYSHPDGAA